MGLTVAEKQHWKERISRRIDKRIEALCAGEPNLMNRIRREARQRALRYVAMHRALAGLPIRRALRQTVQAVFRKYASLSKTRVRLSC
jgi:hypothetical protein